MAYNQSQQGVMMTPNSQARESGTQTMQNGPKLLLMNNRKALANR